MSAAAPPPGTPTRLLLEWGQGQDSAREQMLPFVYDELRRIAASYMRRERPGHTLQPTALVHEAFVRLIDQRQVDWTNRAHFVGVAAMMMRRILANHARARATAKRDGRCDRLTVTVATGNSEQTTVDLLALHEALDRLAALDSRKSQIVELKFFGGLTTTEIGTVMSLSTATVEREWSFARAWLYDAVMSAAP